MPKQWAEVGRGRNMARKFNLIKRGPNLLPIRARTTFAFTLLAITLVVIYSQDIGVSRSLAVFQIVLAGFGALVAYWATTAEEQDLQPVANWIAGFSDTKLSFRDIIHIIIIHYVAIVMFLLYYALALSTARYHPDHLKLPVVACIGILFLFFSSVPAGQYALIKLTRRWCNRWYKRIQSSQDQISVIRNYLKFIGVSSVVLSLLFRAFTIW
jgi:hypothetical protein